MNQLLEKLYSKPPYERGKLFEKFIRKYLKEVDPHYSRYFTNIWLWNNYPERNSRSDMGVDLVAEDISGKRWAIQTKFHKDKITERDISTFLSMLNTHEFDYGMLVITSPLNKNAEYLVECSSKRIEVIDLDYIAENIDEEKFSWEKPEVIARPIRKKLRKYQIEAIDAIIEGFKSNERGKLIMPPGSGKTFVALKLAERLVGTGGRVLFLCPSISLLDQTVRAWLKDSELSLRTFAVVSDKSVGRSTEDDTESLSLLHIPPTTNSEDLLKSAMYSTPECMTVIFSTYQSVEVIEEAQKRGLPKFDLIICDEAHRTTGIKIKNEDPSYFQKVHSDDYIKGDKRLYMTATPRIYEPNVKKKLEDFDVSYYSMDDQKIFGDTFYEYTFRRAVDEGYLSDYKVILFMMDESRVQEKLYRYFLERDALNVENAVKLLGVWKVLQGEVKNEFEEMMVLELKRGIIFTGRIADSKAIEKEFERVVKEYEEDVAAWRNVVIRHIDGSMGSFQRKALLDWLREEPKGEIKILTNAKVLTEGIDVPALDAVVFTRPKNSVVEIIQAVGRVMRKAPGKKYGYIIIPVVIRPNRPEGEQIEESSYKTVWQIVSALRAIDETFAAKVRQVVIKTSKLTPQSIRRSDSSGSCVKYTIDNDSIVTLTVGEQRLMFPYHIKKALIGKIAKSLGLTKKYLENWAKDVAQTAERLNEYITIALSKDESINKLFQEFFESLKVFINEEISTSQAITMLVQHILTKPIFDALFEEYDFVRYDPVAQSLERLSEVFRGYVSRETKDLESFYNSVKLRASGIDKETERQDFMRMLYDSFFKIAFKKTAEELGIVYTPIEVVDFIIKSVDYLLKEKFGKRLSDEDIVILEPFIGTGTFVSRLLHNIPIRSLKRKYESKEIWGNEILLLPYYISKVNIESTYYELTGEYKPFKNLLLVDTFRMMELIYNDQIYPTTISMFPQQYGELLNAEKNAKVNVIISNPPWFAWQEMENKGIKRPEYKLLRQRIKETYAKYSGATNKNSLYDSYIMAIRMATDRIGERGIIGFVTNSGWVDGNAMDGMRKVLEEEFSEIYIIPLRGNARLKGIPRKKEGGGIFGQGSRAGVCIAILVKDRKTPNEKAKIYYHDIGDYLTREEKLEKLRKFEHIGNVDFIEITPNVFHDWINQRSIEYYKFPAIGSKKKDEMGIFEIYSAGLKSNRDAWVYNFSKKELEDNMMRMIEEYNRHVDLVKDGKITKDNINAAINQNSAEISWDSTLKRELPKARKYRFEEAGEIYTSMYRPFVKMHLYFSKVFNNSIHLLPKIFPTPDSENIAICVDSKGSSRPFSALMVNMLPDLHLLPTTQCFPLYIYEQRTTLFKNEFAKRYNISFQALEEYRKRYGDDVTPEDVFYYIYGILHSPDYREKFSSELKKDLPRIPFVNSKELFHLFKEAGEKLANIHLNYEQIEPYSLNVKIDADENDPQTYKITAMKLDKERGILQYNEFITFRGIPPRIFEYEIGGYNPLEWLVNYYKIAEKKKTKIIWNPNKWFEESGDYKYVFELIPRLVTLSLEALEIMTEIQGKL